LTISIDKKAKHYITQTEQLAIILTVLQATDLLTTIYGLQHGLAEVNPLVHITIMTITVKMLLPLILFLASLATIMIAWKEQNIAIIKATVYLFLIITLYMTAITVSNIIHILTVI
jgi:hypothetical protein